MTVTRKWSLLAAVLVVAIFAAGWFLLIAPKRSDAASLKAKAQSQSQANALLVQKLAVLKAQQADLPKEQAKLAKFRSQIPDNPALPSLIRDLTAASRKVGVTIDEMTPQTPVASVSTSVAGAPAQPASPNQPAPTAAVLYQVPLGLKVSGSYFELEQFINKLEGLQRSFLVSGFTVSASESNDPAAPAGLTLDLQGQVFLSSAASAAAPSTPVASAPAGS
jgi:Tfp pilus assembly protein PilO